MRESVPAFLRKGFHFKRVTTADQDPKTWVKLPHLDPGLIAIHVRQSEIDYREFRGIRITLHEGKRLGGRGESGHPIPAPLEKRPHKCAQLRLVIDNQDVSRRVQSVTISPEADEKLTTTGSC